MGQDIMHQTREYIIREWVYYELFNEYFMKHIILMIGISTDPNLFHLV